MKAKGKFTMKIARKCILVGTKTLRSAF